AAALSASRLMGRGDEKAADQAAVDAMRQALNSLSIDGTVVIGEGERDEAPMLFIGEKVGTGQGPKIDIALDPLEGTTITAKGGANALAVLAMADDGGFLNAPDVYMDKIAVGGGLPDGVVDLDQTPSENLRNLARAKKAEIADLVVCILDRRHQRQHVERGAALSRRRVHPFSRDALEDRHRAPGRGRSRFHPQAALRTARPLAPHPVPLPACGERGTQLRRRTNSGGLIA